jgi:hypothetical protein
MGQAPTHILQDHRIEFTTPEESSAGGLDRDNQTDHVTVEELYPRTRERMKDDDKNEDAHSMSAFLPAADTNGKGLFLCRWV